MNTSAIRPREKVASILMAVLLALGVAVTASATTARTAFAAEAGGLEAGGLAMKAQYEYSPYALLKSDGYVYRSDANGNANSYSMKLWGKQSEINDLFDDVEILFIDSDVREIDFKGGLKYQYYYTDIFGRTSYYDREIHTMRYDGMKNISKIVFKLDSNGRNACQSITRQNLGTAGFGNLEQLDEVKNFNKTQLASTPTECFADCRNLVEISMPATLRRLGNATFENCVSLDRVKFNYGLQEIGSIAFKNCYILGAGNVTGGSTVVDIPATVKKIGGGAFSNCESLRTVILRNRHSVVLAPDPTWQAGNIFTGCDNLKSIYVHNIYVNNYKTNSQCKNWQDYKDKIKGWLGVSKVKNTSYTGKAKKPAVKVTWMGKKLSAKTNGQRNYIVKYKKNVKAGTATIVVKGAGKYAISAAVDPDWGIQAKRTFRIYKASVSKAKAYKVAAKRYTGRFIKPRPKVTYGGKTLKRGTDYTLSYKSNKKRGVAKIVIKGKGNFKGTKVVKFRIK